MVLKYLVLSIFAAHVLANKCCRCCDYSIQYSPSGDCSECKSASTDAPAFGVSWDFAPGTCDEATVFPDKKAGQIVTPQMVAGVCKSKCQTMMLTGSTLGTYNPKILEVCKGSVLSSQFKAPPPPAKIATCCQCVDLKGNEDTILGVKGNKPLLTYSVSGSCSKCEFGVLATIAVSNIIMAGVPMPEATNVAETKAAASKCKIVFAGNNGEPALMIKTYAWVNDNLELEVLAEENEGISFAKVGGGAVALSILSIAFVMRSYDRSSKVTAVYEVLNDEI